MYKYYLGLIGLIFLVLSYSCQDQGDDKTGDRAKYQSLTKNEIVILQSDSEFQRDFLPPMEVPYRKMHRYFVRNDFKKDSAELKIESKAQFEEVFAPAATMGRNGLPSEIRFENEFVIALVLPITNRSAKLEPVGLQRLADGSLLLNYKVSYGSEQTFTTRPFIGVIVEKQFNDKIRIQQIF